MSRARRTPRTGCYPGSFNPPTRAHLAIASAAVDQCGLHALDLVISRRALGKSETPEGGDALFHHRIAVLEAVAASRPWLGVRVTDAQLLADVSEGYDLLVMGADKWWQVVDPAWYGSADARDAAVARLPDVALVARPPHPSPLDEQDHFGIGVVMLDLPPAVIGGVSSSAVRAGEHHHMVDEAAEFAARTGAWIDPERYRRSRASR